MPKLIYLDENSDYLPALKEKLPGWEIIYGAPADDKAIKHLADAEVYYGWWDSRIGDMLDTAQNLKWIQVISAGVDNIPLEALRDKGVLLTSANGVHANNISETIFGMMLGFARNLFNLHRDQTRKAWRDDRSVMKEIHGKAIGIIGAGAIGCEVARLAKAFEMRTIGMRRSGGGAPHVDEMLDGAGLHKLLSESDYIVNILPLTPETEGMIGKPEFAAMKPTAYYFTAGRGKTTDQDALIEALRQGKLAGAGLDVTDPEPLPKDSPLWEMENVFIGGHTSGGTDRYQERAMEIFMRNLDDYLTEKIPGCNLVDYKKQY